MFKKRLLFLLIVLLSFTGGMIGYAEEPLARDERKSTPSGIAFSDLEAFVDDYVKDYIGKTSAGASIVIVKDGQMLLSKGYGYADLENQVPVTQKTVFEWGSISKLAVWTAVMQLAEQGKIALDADIRTYLPPHFLSRLKYDDPITMLNLMNHNAGFEEYMFDMAYQSPEKVRSLEEGLRLAQPAQVYKPGEVVAYSNYANSLAAFIVERLSGQKFYEYAAEHIFAKLDMKETTANPTVADRPDLIADKSKGYTLAGHGKFTPGSWNYMSMYPNGGNNGTAEDLAKLAMAFMPAAGAQSPLFERPETLREMLAQSYAADADMPGIAHGFWEYPGVRRTLGHGGNTIAFSSNLQLVPEEQFAVAVMTNQAAESDIVYGLTKALLGMREMEAVKEDLPGSAELEGSFIAARRPYNGFMNLYSYLTLLKIKPVGPHDIRISLSGMTADYTQIRPYLYAEVSGDTALDSFPMLHFKVTGGHVDNISMYTTEYLPLPAGKSMPVLIANAILAILSVLFFILFPLVLLFQAIRNKWKKRTYPAGQSGMRKFAAGLTLTGTAIIVNNLVLALRMLSNYERAYSEVFPQIVMNYILTLLAFLLIAGLLLYRKRKKPVLSTSQKWAAALPVGPMVVLVGLLVFWQFYQ